MTTDHARQCAEALVEVGKLRWVRSDEAAEIIARHIAAAVAEETRELRAEIKRLREVIQPMLKVREPMGGTLEDRIGDTMKGNP